MPEPIHIAITRRGSPAHVAEFERPLAEFASQSLAEPGMRGVHVLYPPSGSTERIEPLVEGAPSYRHLHGLEAFVRAPQAGPPPRWKMALLPWLAVWPVSMAVPALLLPLIGQRLPSVVTSGVIGAGIAIVLTCGAMPLLVTAAARWLHPKE